MLNAGQVFVIKQDPFGWYFFGYMYCTFGRQYLWRWKNALMYFTIMYLQTFFLDGLGSCWSKINERVHSHADISWSAIDFILDTLQIDINSYMCLYVCKVMQHWIHRKLKQKIEKNCIAEFVKIFYYWSSYAFVDDSLQTRTPCYKSITQGTTL